MPKPPCEYRQNLLCLQKLSSGINPAAKGCFVFFTLFTKSRRPGWPWESDLYVSKTSAVAGQPETEYWPFWILAVEPLNSIFFFSSVHNKKLFSADLNLNFVQSIGTKFSPGILNLPLDISAWPSSTLLSSRPMRVSTALPLPDLKKSPVITVPSDKKKTKWQLNREIKQIVLISLIAFYLLLKIILFSRYWLIPYHAVDRIPILIKIFVIDDHFFFLCRHPTEWMERLNPLNGFRPGILQFFFYADAYLSSCDSQINKRCPFWIQ